MGWVKHMLPASADSSLRSDSKLTTFHHVKLGCLDWIRSDLLWSILAVTHHFVFFEMVTKTLIVHFFQPDNSVTCLPLWVGVRLAPFQSRGCSLLCHNSIGTIESSFKAVSANSFTILGQNSLATDNPDTCILSNYFPTCHFPDPIWVAVAFFPRVGVHSVSQLNNHFFYFYLNFVIFSVLTKHLQCNPTV